MAHGRFFCSAVLAEFFSVFSSVYSCAAWIVTTYFHFGNEPPRLLPFFIVMLCDDLDLITTATTTVIAYVTLYSLTQREFGTKNVFKIKLNFIHHVFINESKRSFFPFSHINT